MSNPICFSKKKGGPILLTVQFKSCTWITSLLTIVRVNISRTIIIEPSLESFQIMRECYGFRNATII